MNKRRIAIQGMNYPEMRTANLPDGHWGIHSSIHSFSSEDRDSSLISADKDSSSLNEARVLRSVDDALSSKSDDEDENDDDENNNTSPTRRTDDTGTLSSLNDAPIMDRPGLRWNEDNQSGSTKRPVTITREHNMSVTIRPNSSQTRPLENNFKVFVILPNKNVCTLKDTNPGTGVTQLKQDIELLSGIPGEIYSIQCPNGGVIQDNTTLTSNKLQDGAILKMLLHSGWDRLFNAVWNGETGAVYANVTNQKISENGAIKRVIEEWKAVALYIGAHKGHFDLVDMLLKLGTDVNTTTQYGRTPLHACASQDKVSMADKLLEYGADPRLADNQGARPVNVASRFGAKACTRRLRLATLNLSFTDSQRLCDQEDVKHQESSAITNTKQKPKDSNSIGVSLQMNMNELRICNGPNGSLTVPSLNCIKPSRKPTVVMCYPDSNADTQSRDPSSSLDSQDTSKSSSIDLSSVSENTPSSSLGSSSAFTLSSVESRSSSARSFTRSLSSDGEDAYRRQMVTPTGRPFSAMSHTRSLTDSIEGATTISRLPLHPGRVRSQSARTTRSECGTRYARLRQSETIREERKKKASQAFDAWLAKKATSSDATKQTTQESENEDDDTSKQITRDQMFQKWLAKKKEDFRKASKKSKDIDDRGMNRRPRFKAGYRDIFKIGNTQDAHIETPPIDHNENSAAFSQWLQKKSKDGWFQNTNSYIENENDKTLQKGVKAKNEKLCVSAISHSEWLEAKYEQIKIEKKRLKNQEVNAKQVSARGKTYQNWVNDVSQRERERKEKEEERKQREATLKALDESWRKSKRGSKSYEDWYQEKYQDSIIDRMSDANSSISGDSPRDTEQYRMQVEDSFQRWSEKKDSDAILKERKLLKHEVSLLKKVKKKYRKKEYEDATE
ncbi:unnamed protein product [Owenia fusiformis]|uniref:Uncharacterized protein n=1 Tax=Owenia fusiformis TaxID=6347 RepID=A0A8J1Y7Y7_OWEFU|nr:unnamed protein product [Owenia fusiformis]